MDHPYQKRPIKRGQCRFCPEIHKKFSDLLRHEATHRLPKEDPQPEVTKESGKQIIKKESENVDIIQTPKEPLRDANIQDASLDPRVYGEISHSPSKNSGAKLADLRIKTISVNSHMDLDAEIRERIRKYDWTKDFRKIYIKGEKVATYICKICSKSMGGWKDKNKLLYHIFSHNGERPFQCQMCPKRYKTPHARKRHEIIHTGKRPYKCSKCPKDFNNSSHLSRHKKSHSLKQINQDYAVKNVVTRDVILCLDRVDYVTEYSHVCKQALKKLNNSIREGARNQLNLETEFKERIRNYDWTKDFFKFYPENSKNAAYKCNICSAINVRKDRLLSHTFFHTGERPFKCSKCPQKFRHPEAMKQHELRNKNAEKCRQFPNNCKVRCLKISNIQCPKKILPIQLDLDAEIRERIRTYDWTKDFMKIEGKNAYICKICSGSNVRKDRLLNHTFIHTGESPYRCHHIHCPEMFQSPKTRKTHENLHKQIQIKGPELPYKCVLCSERFRDPIELYNHRKIHFPNGVKAEKDTSHLQKNEPEILESSSKIQNFEIKSEEIEIPVNPIDILRQTETRPVDPDVNDKSFDEAAHTFPKEKISPSISTPRMISGPKLPMRRRMNLRVQKPTYSGNSQMDPDAEIKERIRIYDWTKDFRKICTKAGKANIYRCKICSFKKMRFYKRDMFCHTFVHTGERPFQCTQCPNRFKNSIDRKRHEIAHTGQRFYKCSNCSQDFIQSHHLSRHMKLSCPKGNANKNTTLPIKNEILQESPKIPDFSGYFSFKLGFTQNLKISLSRVDKVEEHMDVYGQALERLQNSDASGVRKNQKPGKRPKKPLKTESTIKKYFKKVKDGKFECLQCHQRVKCPRTHRWTHFPSKIPCNICRKNFKSQFTLNRHMKNIHLGIKRNILKSSCKFCGKEIANYNLRDHEDCHQGIKRHICSICSKGFTFKTEYCQHLKKHAKRSIKLIRKI